MENVKNSTYIDWNRQPDMTYPLQYIYESDMARMHFLQLQDRISMAMDGKPFRNLYQEHIKSNLESIKDNGLRSKLEAKCMKLPEGQSFALYNAVKNRATQMSSGVDTYEYQVNDPYMIINDDTEDLLAAQCEQDYMRNKLGNLAAVFSRDLSTMGVTAVKVEYDPLHDRNTVKRINPKNIIWDTKYSSTGCERFRGYNTMISWRKLKKLIESNPDEQINLNISAPNEAFWKEEKGDKDPYYMVDEKAAYSNRKIRSLNGLDVYVDGMNKLAASSQFWSHGNHDTWEFMHDLRHCYAANYYQSFATAPEARTNTGYQGDDVELTVLFDMVNHVEYKIINRRYVISANSASYRRFINFPVTNPDTGEVVPYLHEFEVDCPIKFQFEWSNNRDVAPWPTSDVMKLLDMHDKLCSLRAMREHVVDILAILRVITNAGDASELAESFNIMGVALTEVQGDIETLALPYDFNPIDSQITYLEQEIKRTLSGYDEFDAMQSMGDRATAAESGMASGAIAQGLTIHQNAIMEMYAGIARQCIANRVAYSSASEFPITGRGVSSALTTQQMALDAIINVKPKSAKLIQEKTIAVNAITLLGSLKDVLTPSGLSFLCSQALLGTAPRSALEGFIQGPQPDQAAVQAAQLEGQNMADILSQNQQMYEENPLQYEANNAVQNSSPESVDEVIRQLSEMNAGGGDVAAGGGAEATAMPIESSGQDGAMAVDMEGISSDLASALANPASMV